MSVEIGSIVCMTEECKAELKANGSSQHAAEFGRSVGVVEELADWGNDVRGPEVRVRWFVDDLRYTYHPRQLRVIEELELKGSGRGQGT